MALSQQPPQETASALMGRIVDEYLERADRGERPKIEEYERRHPELAEVIRKMLPTLQMMHVSAGLDATNDLQPEEQITPEAPLGDFRIIRELGRGGMGVVYEAQQISLGRTVALKVLPFAAAMDERHLQRFKNEALAAAHLDHPNIVDVYGVGCERGVHFYAMRHIDGQSLATVIEELRGQDDGDQRRAAIEDGRNEHSDSTPSSADAMLSTGPIAALSTERTANSRELYRSAARLIKQAADALEHAHQMGVLHRDVKPGNLLLDRRGNLWVTDFGLAQVQSSTQLTMTGDLLGTLRYMSPEQALAKRITVDHRTDVYSLGATLYELLTLQSVFSGRDREELLRQIAFEEPKAPRRKKPSIPVELETIVLRAIAKNPDDRYASAGEMADDLQRFIDDKPIRARRPTLVQHVARLGRRHRSVAITIGTSLVLAVIGLTVATAVISGLYRKAARASDELAATVDDRNQALGRLQEKSDETSEALAAERTAREELVEANAREKVNNYSYAVALAHRSALEGDFAHAMTLLLECPEELRQWEWHFTRGLCSSNFIRYGSASRFGLGPIPPTRLQERAESGTSREQGEPVTTPRQRRPATGQERPATSPGQERSRSSLTQAAARGSFLSRMPSSIKAPFRPEKPILAIPERGAVAVIDAASGDVLYKRQREPDATSRPSSAFGLCAFSPDGDLLAISLGETAVRVLDAESGDEKFAVEGHSRPVTDVVFSPDGKWLASSDAAGEVRVWDLETQECTYTWNSGGGAIWEVFFLGDGPEQMACVTQYGEEAKSNAWANPRRLIFGFRGETVNGELRVTAVTKASPAQKAGLRADDRVLELTGKPVGTMAELKAHLKDAQPGESLVFSIERDSQRIDLEMVPMALGELTIDSQRVPSRSGLNEGLHAFDATTGAVQFTKIVTGGSVSCRGPYIALAEIPESTDDGATQGSQSLSRSLMRPLLVLDSRTGDVVSEFEGTGITFDAGSTQALVYGQRGLSIVDPASGEKLKHLLEERGMIRSAVFSPDRTLVAAITLADLFIVDAQSGRVIGRYSSMGPGGPKSLLSFSSDGRYLAQRSAFGIQITVWNLARLQAQRRGTLVAEDLGLISKFALSPTGDHFAAAVVEGEGDDRVAKFVIGLTTTGEVREFDAPDSHFGRIRLVFSRDGKSVVFGILEGPEIEERAFLTRIYSTTTLQELSRHSFELEKGTSTNLPSFNGLAVTSDRALVLLGDCLLDVKAGEPVLDLDFGARAWPSLSPDGRFIATYQGSRIRITDVSDSREINIAASRNIGRPAGFSDDCRYLLASRGDSVSLRGDLGAPSVSILDTESGELLSTYSPRRAVPSAREFSFNAAGTRLAICERYSTDLAVVDVRIGRELIYLPHRASLAGVGFHPDGNRLYTATEDGTITMWDGTPQPVEELAFTPSRSAPLNVAGLARRMIGRFDNDGDEKLSQEESPMVWSRLSKFDHDGDDKLDADEIQSAIEENRKNRQGGNP